MLFLWFWYFLNLQNIYILCLRSFSDFLHQGHHSYLYFKKKKIRIQKVVEKSGYKVIMTSSRCLTGTDRVSQAAKKINSNSLLTFFKVKFRRMNLNFSFLRIIWKCMDELLYNRNMLLKKIYYKPYEKKSI